MNSSKSQHLLSNLTGVFFISGFSALIYQVCWQRLLFTGFGIDLTSITIIISIFMAGLGIGAFFGGRIADRFPNKQIHIFCLVELIIGLFGLISYHLIAFINHWLIDASQVFLTISIFFTLLIPTFLMGATLPLLTSFFNQILANIGQSIGTLYFYNTLGAALGSLSTGFFLFNYLTLSQTIYLAACLNILIALFIFFQFGKKHVK